MKTPKMNLEKFKTSKLKKIAIIATVLITMFLISKFMIFAQVIRSGASFNSCNKFTWKLMNPVKRIVVLKHTPRDSSKILMVYPNYLNNSIIIMHKLGCTDCVKSHDFIEEEINKEKDQSNIYFTEVSTKIAREMIENYGITDVPVAIIMTEQPILKPLKTKEEVQDAFNTWRSFNQKPE